MKRYLFCFFLKERTRTGSSLSELANEKLINELVGVTRTSATIPSATTPVICIDQLTQACLLSPLLYCDVLNTFHRQTAIVQKLRNISWSLVDDAWDLCCNDYGPGNTQPKCLSHQFADLKKN